MKLKDLCADERPREKMLSKGPAALSHAELLAVLLRSGTGEENVLDLARSLLSAAEGRLSVLSSFPLESFCAFKGIGPAKALTLQAALELGKRTLVELSTPEKRAVRDARDVYSLLIPVLSGLDHEECWAVFLNASGYLLGKELLTSGTLDRTMIDSRQVARRALEKRARSVILVHNHPSGNPAPGESDIRQTDIVRHALSTFDILLLDHVIVAEDSYYSFSEEKITSAGKKLSENE